MRSGSVSSSVSEVRRKSIISHRLPVPTESGRAMDICGCGLKPSEYFSFSPARANTRCIVRIMSRCEMYIARPVFSNLNLILSIAASPVHKLQCAAAGALVAAVR